MNITFSYQTTVMGREVSEALDCNISIMHPASENISVCSAAVRIEVDLIGTKRQCLRELSGLLRQFNNHKNQPVPVHARGARAVPGSKRSPFPIVIVKL